MSAVVELRKQIETTLGAFASAPLLDASLGLFELLGYQSERRMKLRSSTAEGFLGTFDRAKTLNPERALIANWRSIEFLFQLTDAEVQSAAHGMDELAFDSKGKFDGAEINSYLFLAIELTPRIYTRTELAGVTRSLNRLFDMPAMLLFKHGDTISLGIIHRRLNKRDQAKDVLEKVTLVKDIAFADPIRAHVEILNDFAFANLDADFGVSNFVRLHEAWQKRLGSYALSNDFYREIADWYFWAHHQVDDGTIRLPQHCDTEQEKSLFLIRLLTRVIFSWFLVEKRLIPTELFREHRLKSLLKEFNPGKDPKKPDTAPTYYHAILQNLFFGTLNMPPDQRGFREKKKDGQRYDQNFGITNLWRYETDFRNPADWLTFATRVPFLNGGLFDCLDDKSGQKKDNFILDGFSDNPKLACHLPNDLFFGPERNVDLSRDYGEEDKSAARSRKAKVRGLIEILSRYKFTIEENTPLEEEIALDPELLGKVFENLLASYNEDTRTTARKALGAFYTPREIVSYMVDEALKSYLTTQVPRCKGALDDLFSNKATLKEIKPDTRDLLIAAIGRVKILDPACGSGAFPMGALHRLVDLLQKLDPNNESWKRDRLTEARWQRAQLEKVGAANDEIDGCDARIADIEKSFDTRFHALDFARKLYLIENSIYGVDIQPIATQIAKLRFFISLVVDQKVDMKADNLGVRPLPNLETRLVAADTLVPLPKPKEKQGGLFDDASPEDYLDHNRLKNELSRVRHEHFNAKDPRSKRKWRDEDERIRGELKDLLKRVGLPANAARAMAAWDPYDQNAYAPFFDSEWMFGLPIGKVRLEGRSPATLLGNFALINEADGQTELTSSTSREIDSGFDIVIGNPPYVRQEQLKHLKEQFKQLYECFTGTADLYVFFYEVGIKQLKPGGCLAYISSNSFFTSAFAKPLRTYLTTRTQLLVLIDFAETGVFKAITEPAIVILKRDQAPDGNVQMLRWNEDEKPENVGSVMVSRSEKLSVKELKPDGWRLESGTNLRLLDRINNAGKPLSEYVHGRFYYGIKTGLNEAFVVDRATRDRLVSEHKSSANVLAPFLRGRDIRRWRVDYADQYLIKIESSENKEHPWSSKTNSEAERIFKKTYPAIHAHFETCRAALKGRYDQGKFYWELRSCDYWSAFEGPKIVYQDIARYFGMAWDESAAFLGNTCYFIPAAQKWMLGVLLSSPMQFYVQKTLGSEKGGFLRLFSIHVGKFPIPSANSAQQAIVELVVNCLLHLAAHAANSSPDTQTTRDPLMLAYWERVLNGLVYELYFPEEVRGAGLNLFDLVAQAHFPDISTISEAQRLPRLRKLFEALHDGTHPLRIALDKLQTLDTVRIIEGKA